MSDTIDPAVVSTFVPVPRGVRKGECVVMSVAVSLKAALGTGPLLLHKCSKEHPLRDWPRFFLEHVRPSLSLEVDGRTVLPRHVEFDGRSDVWTALFPGWLAVRDPRQPGNKRIESLRETEAMRVVSQGGDPNNLRVAGVESFSGRDRPTGGAAGSVHVEPDDSIRDFHTRLSGASAIPTLARALGLVFDIEADIAPNAERLRVQVLPVVAWGRTPRCPTVRLDTELRRRANLFTALRAPTSRDIGERGFGAITGARLVDLERTATMITELDPVALADARRHTDQPLRQVGLGDQVLVMNARAASRLGIWARRSQELAAQIEMDSRGAELFAEDLMRGLALDIRDWRSADPGWKPLCRREGSYWIGRKRIPIPCRREEEIPIEFAPLASRTEDAWYASEVAFRLDGWSLVCPRPGSSRSEVHAATGIEADLHPPRRSLVRWRWGSTYLVRARPIGLDGEDMSGAFRGAGVPSRSGKRVIDRDLASENREHTLEFTFKRLAPIAPPVVVPTRLCEVAEHRGGGDPQGIAHLVIGYQFRGTDHRVEHRYLYPPKVAWRVLELSGELDGLAERKAYDLWKTRSADLPRVSKGDKAEYLMDPFAGGVGVRVPNGSGSSTLPTRRSRRRRKEVVADNEWLLRFPKRRADSSSPIEIALRRAHHTKSGDEDEKVWKRLQDSSAHVPPNLLGRVTVRVDHVVRRLTVRVPEGMTYEMALRSTVRGERRTQHRLLDWLSTDENRDDVVTPSTPLRFTHVVPTPVLKPHLLGVASPLDPVVAARGSQIGELGPEVPRVQRELSSSDARVAFTVAVHKPTTGRLTAIATAYEATDMGSSRCAHRTSTHVLSRTDIPDDRDGLVPGLHGMARMRIEGTEAIATSKHVVLVCDLEAATRFEHYYSKDPSGTTPARAHRALRVSIPSTKPPAPPRVSEIVPLQSLGATRAGQDLHARCVPGFRIYLEREWFSSGDGELLAVVAQAEADGAAPAAARTFSTWGNDPTVDVHSSHVPINFRPMEERRPPLDTSERVIRPSPGAWYNRAIENYVLPRGEEAQRRVHLFLAKPTFDDLSKKWVVDVDLSVPSTYSPFVRLVLARFQPESVPGAEISDVVWAQFVQPLPERSITVIRDRRLRIIVRGVAPTGNEMAAFVRDRSHETRITTTIVARDTSFHPWMTNPLGPEQASATATVCGGSTPNWIEATPPWETSGWTFVPQDPSADAWVFDSDSYRALADWQGADRLVLVEREAIPMLSYLAPHGSRAVPREPRAGTRLVQALSLPL